MTLRFRLPAGVVLALVLVMYCSAGEKMQYRLEKGKTYNYVLNVDNATNVHQAAQTASFTSHSSLQYTITVDEVGSTSITFIAVTKKFVATISAPMMGIIDSTVSPQRLTSFFITPPGARHSASSLGPS